MLNKIILVGGPNVGKSVIFSRLTGANVIISNYPGTTIDYSKGKILLENRNVEIIDSPGAYSLTPSDKAEKVTSKIIEKLNSEKDMVINIINAANLERDLFLTLELLEKKIPVIVALNLWDEAKHNGIEINVKKLEKLLGVPVVPTVATTGEGIKLLVSRLKEVKLLRIKSLAEKDKWIKIGKIIKEVQEIKHRHHTIGETLADATVRPITGIPIALIIIILSFWIVRFIGENLIGYIFEPLFEFYKPLAMSISNFLGPGFLHEILIGKLIEGEIEYVQSMGLLTTGLFVPFGMVLPYIFAFYFTLSILEDTGYLPRLATLADNIFHKLGMHGYGIVPVFLGLGCNVPGALATRILATKKQRFIALILLVISVPCMAQTAMIFGILGSYGLSYIFTVYITLLIVYIIVGILLNAFVKGESPEIFLEIPPYRKPSTKAVLKKTWMRVKWFLKEAIPYLFLGVLLVNILYAVGFFDFIGIIFAPIMENWFGLPKEAIIAILVGFLRKDLAVGMLLPLGLNAMQLVIATVILTITFPCAATFAVLIKELGFKDMLKALCLMILIALVVGGSLRLILLGI